MDLLYDWKLHYADPLRSLGVQDGFAVYRIENESGSGFVRSCTVFPGIQLVLNDLQMQYCARSVPPSAQVLELLVLLSDPATAELGDVPKYLSRGQVQLARRARERITRDLAAHLTVAELAAELGVGATTLKTAFRGVYGASLYAYQKTGRMLEGQRLLRETALPVSEIAAMVGYANPGKFTQAFRDRFGVTPAVYRKAARLDSF